MSLAIHCSGLTESLLVPLVEVVMRDEAGLPVIAFDRFLENRKTSTGELDGVLSFMCPAVKKKERKKVARG